MDIYVIMQVIILFGAIFLGVRLGGMGIGYAGGLGVVLLSLGMGMFPGQIPWDVILIIMSAIAAICALQLAGGLDYLVRIAENILRKNPKHINYLAPTVTYFLTILAGTGHTAFFYDSCNCRGCKEREHQAVRTTINCRCSEPNWYYRKSCIRSGCCYEWIP